jgi:hypothetical protein
MTQTEKEGDLVRLQTEQALRNTLGDKPLFDVAETARILCRSPAWLYRMMGDGRLKYVQMGSRRAITRAVIVRALTEGVRPSV